MWRGVYDANRTRGTRLRAQNLHLAGHPSRGDFHFRHSQSPSAESLPTGRGTRMRDERDEKSAGNIVGARSRAVRLSILTARNFETAGANGSRARIDRNAIARAKWN